MNISSISSAQHLGKELTQGIAAEKEDGQPSFAKMLENSVAHVDELLKTSDKKATEVATGKSENLHDAMVSFEKADVAFKLLVQVRNKAMDAYHEVMRMQV